MAQDTNHRAADFGKQQIAAVYAKSLLHVAEEDGETAAVLEELHSLVNDVLAKFPDLERTLTSTLIDHEQKEAMLDRVLGKQASPLLLRFLKVLSAHGRLDCLRPIWQALSEQYNKIRGLVEVELRVARRIEPALEKEIADALRQALSAEPVVRVVEDEDLIGGFVIRIGDTVYDGSVATQLRHARNRMVQKSVEMIETRREQLL
jgi:F-type H+-transporting ATPase subunit delta